ncbi:hypothetical protein AB205_0049070, partial [Aquarana catesbeiana]
MTKLCVCLQNGNVQCLTKRCPPLACSEPYPVPGECCPQCPVPPADCPYTGITYRHMQRFYDPSDKCRDCICNNGTVTCQRKPCAPTPCTHPLQGDCCRSCDGNIAFFYDGSMYSVASIHCFLNCGKELKNELVNCQRVPCSQDCSHPVPSPLSPCCPVCDRCLYEGNEYSNRQTFNSLSNPCLRCVCLEGSVTCTHVVCPQIYCANPVSKPGQCCKECPGTDTAAYAGTKGKNTVKVHAGCLPQIHVCNAHVKCHFSGILCMCFFDLMLCVSLQSGSVQCEPPTCPTLPCTQQVTDPGACCPRCR